MKHVIDIISGQKYFSINLLKIRKEYYSIIDELFL